MAVLALVLGAAILPAGRAMAAETEDGEEEADRIIVTGASGALAGEAIGALLSRGVTLETLILVTRTPDKLASYLANGADVRFGDFDDPTTLEDAFKGGRRMLLISTSGGDRVAQHTAAINAARSAGVKHIVYTSFTNPVAENPAVVARDHRLTEEALERSGVPYTILRNQLYSDGLVAEAAQAVATGEIYTNAGRGMWAPVAREDCGAAAAVVLTTSGHEGKIYDITGPQLINRKEFADLITEVSGRRVRVIQVSDAVYIERAMRSGMSEAAAKASASFGLAMRANMLNIRNEALQILLGREPQSVRELLVRNKSGLEAPGSGPGNGRGNTR